ncbi:MAG: 7-carboxy-7-deazaguanine synthase [Rhodospirillales bacterium]
MAYAVKEIFYSLQGEGRHAGRPAVFLRFAGCNLWNGIEADRGHAACPFCDTDFVGTDGHGGGRFDTADALAAAVANAWASDASGGDAGERFVVVTGGEPALQLDAPLLAALRRHGFRVAIETNGTRPLPDGLDWVCVSPKAAAPLLLTAGDELKLVFPQAGAEPERFQHLDFRYFFLQPMDGPQRERHTRLALAYCLAHPRWRLSLQLHKVLGIP